MQHPKFDGIINNLLKGMNALDYKSELKSMYLDSLKIFMKDRGKIIKYNQITILTMLLSKNQAHLLLRSLSFLCGLPSPPAQKKNFEAAILLPLFFARW